MNDLKITYIQSEIVWQNKIANFDYFAKQIEIVGGTTDLIVLPEMFSTGFVMQPEPLAEDFSGATLKWMKQTAQNHSIAVCGSIVFGAENNYYNRFLFVKPNSEVEFYDKRHLFRMAHEHEHYTAGNKFSIINYKGWRIRPFVCYDLRFPVWSRNRSNYDLMIYVANWPESRRMQWKHLLLARAIENQTYVVAVNRIGSDGNGFVYSGDSLVINPIGEILNQIKTGEPNIETVTLSATELQKARERFPFYLDADSFYFA